MIFSLNKKKTPYTEKGRNWYDTKKGIAKAIMTLEGLHRLRRERYQAGYVREESLNRMYVFGRYLLDTVGNFTISETDFNKHFPDIPPVLTGDEYSTYIKEKTGVDYPGISFSFGQSLPTETVLCSVCNSGWNIKNVHDVVQERLSQVYDLSDFLGKTLSHTKRQFSQKTDALYFIGAERFLRSDKFIDLSPFYEKPETDFQRNQVKNKDGWVGVKDGITDEYIISKGDSIIFDFIKFSHRKCNADKLAQEELVSEN